MIPSGSWEKESKLCGLTVILLESFGEPDLSLLHCLVIDKSGVCVIVCGGAQVVEDLKRLGREDILVVCGGVIPPQDHQFLHDSGVTAVYGPGTNIPEAARQLVDLILTAQQQSPDTTTTASSSHS